MNGKMNRAGKTKLSQTSAVPARPEKLGEILGRLFAARGWGRRHERLRMEEAWAAIVGPRASGHTRVGVLRRGVLEIVVDSSVLLQELAHFQKRRLLEQLRERLTSMSINDLRFRSGTITNHDQPS